MPLKIDNIMQHKADFSVCVPGSLEEITSDWLEEVLRLVFGMIDIDRLSIYRTGEGCGLTSP